MRGGDHDAAIGTALDDRVADDLGRRGAVAEVDVDVVGGEDLGGGGGEARRPETRVIADHERGRGLPHCSRHRRWRSCSSSASAWLTRRTAGEGEILGDDTDAGQPLFSKQSVSGIGRPAVEGRGQRAEWLSRMR